MDREFIGNNFYNLITELGEDYTLETLDGEEYTGKISLVAKTASTYMLAEREYLMSGTATFPDINSQTTFRGCYFKREINPERTYIMVSTIPKDTTPYVADVYAIECNTKVSLAYLVQKKDEFSDTVNVPEIYAEDVMVYWDSTLQKQQRSSDGNFDNTISAIQIPARYGLTLDDVVIRKIYRFNAKLGEDEIVEQRYRVEAIDVAMSTLDMDGRVYGIYDVQLSLDNRY